MEELTTPFATLNSKKPHDTCWLTVTLPKDASIAEIVTVLAAEGWTRDTRRKWWPSVLDYVEIEFQYPGTGPFSSWTPAESKKAVAGAKKACRALNLALYRKKLRLEDML